MFMVVDAGELRLSSDYIDEPDVVATGSLISLARLAGPAAEDLVRDGVVGITGDAVLAGQFQKLLYYGRPDFEEELSAVIGDAAAHSVGELARDAGSWSRQTRDTMRQNVSEYLKEERRAVPARFETDAFRDDLNALRDDVERFEARLRKLERDHA